MSHSAIRAIVFAPPLGSIANPLHLYLFICRVRSKT